MNELQKFDSNTLAKQILSKVPEITIFFWIIKILCTTVGETAADFLNVNLNFGLTGTSVVTGVLLVIALVFQFKAKKYIPTIYWATVALVSVFGTLVTDNLTDRLGVPLETSTIVFSILLGITFLIWYLKEKTLSIHSIFTVRREVFYWLTILFTFALGTAAGDLMAEALGLGYLITGIIVSSIIAITAAAWKLKLNPVLSFWIIYILTRPLGASIGDLLSQPSNHGGLGLGSSLTSFIFVGGIIGIVLYLSITKKDTIGKNYSQEIAEDEQKGGLWQTAVVVILFVVAGVLGYHFRQAALRSDNASQTQTGTSGNQNTATRLGDLSFLRTITLDTLNKLNAGDQSGATGRISDLEYEWDSAQSRLKPRDTQEWTLIDGKIDTVLREIRAVHPNLSSEKDALQALLAVLK